MRAVLRMSAANWVEAAIVVDSHRDPAARVRFDDLVGRSAACRSRPFTVEDAYRSRAAHNDYGRGHHRARLNYRRLLRLRTGQASRRTPAVQGQRLLADRHRAGAEGLTCRSSSSNCSARRSPRACRPARPTIWPVCATEALAPLAPASIRTFFGPRRIALAAEVARAGCRRQHDRARPTRQCARAGARRLSAQAQRQPRAVAPGGRLLGAGQDRGRDSRRDADRRRHPAAAAPLPVAEVDALGRHQQLRLGPSAASHRLPAGRRGGAVRPARRRGRWAWAGIGRPDRGPSLPRPRRIRRAVVRRLGGEAARAPRHGRCRGAQADHREGASPRSPRNASSPSVDDPGLLDEVAGLVEWPVPLLGRIDEAYMDLPAEVRQVSMRVNQRYFAFRNADGSAAPYFGFVANIEPSDGGAISIAGNERVLRARFADARHFWDLDRKARLESRVPLLDHVTFHAKLGTPGRAGAASGTAGGGDRSARRCRPGAGPRRARLAKADLVTGMVGEFPELQGVMGRYYALHDGEDALVADAIRDHYAPKGPTDAVPTAGVSIAVALADKLDLLVGFFAIGERPTGVRRSLCPAPRRAGHHPDHPRERPAAEPAAADRSGGRRPGITAACIRCRRRRFSTSWPNACACSFARRAPAMTSWPRCSPPARTTTSPGCWRAPRRSRPCLTVDDGANLLTAYRRAANILRIEERKDGPHDGEPDRRSAASGPRKSSWPTRSHAAGEAIQPLPGARRISRRRWLRWRDCVPRSTHSSIR